MHRRKFLETLLATGTTAWIAGAPSSLDAATLLQTPTATSPPPSSEIKRVLIVFKCHFDAGFIDTQANVIHRYFNVFFPKAIEPNSSAVPRAPITRTTLGPPAPGSSTNTSSKLRPNSAREWSKPSTPASSRGTHFHSVGKPS
ncbi:MAG: hypothetical protein JO260_07615 [Acidobacteria bacterium]|nr:hypothetical protein [Acidobacteriota bacterium]